MTEGRAVRKRASRYKRLDSPRSMLLTDRDKQVVKAVNDYRMLRQDQVQRLFFPSRNTAQVRLWLLWQHGFLKRLFLPVLGGIQTSPILYEIDQRGADLLRAEFGYSSKELRSSGGKISGFRFLEHTIGLSEIRVAVNLSCRRNGYALNTWLDEKTLKGDYDRVRVGNEWLAVIPDGYFVVELPGGAAHFFIEFDRGPERLEVFRKKIAAYLAYYRSGQCKLRYKTDRIRVLTITQAAPTGPGKQRIENLKRLVDELKGQQRFWFSSLEQVSCEDFFSAAIWQHVGTDELTSLFSS